MNIGQVLRSSFRIAAKKLGWHVATPVFDGANEEDISETLEKSRLSRGWKTIIIEMVEQENLLIIE
jgi:DNA-directed RNA polymerase subunit beta